MAWYMGAGSVCRRRARSECRPAAPHHKYPRRRRGPRGAANGAAKSSPEHPLPAQGERRTLSLPPLTPPAPGGPSLPRRPRSPSAATRPGDVPAARASFSFRVLEGGK